MSCLYNMSSAMDKESPSTTALSWLSSGLGCSPLLPSTCQTMPGWSVGWRDDLRRWEARLLRSFGCEAPGPMLATSTQCHEDHDDDFYLTAFLHCGM
jgi:hypothetical protein